MKAKNNPQPIQRKVMISPLAKHWPILALGLLATILLLGILGRKPLNAWDEALYAQVAKEMVQSGEWLTLHYGYEPWIDKPPLLMWTVAVFYRLFGVNEFWSRIPSSFSGILLVIVTYLIGKLIYDRWVGFLAGIILLTSYGFVKYARLCMTDTVLSLFVFLAVYSYLRLRSGSQKWWYPIWASLGLAIMAKSWAAVIIPATILIVLLVDRSVRAALGSRHFWQGLLLAFAIAAPWHILMWVRLGSEFINEYMGYNLLRRMSPGIEGHAGGPLMYIELLQRHLSPWIYLTPIAVALAIRDNVDERTKSFILLTLVAVVFGAYTFVVSTKHSQYIYPVYPALAILAGATVSEAFRRKRSMAFGGLVFAALVSTLIAPTELLYLVALGVSLIVVTCWFRLTRTGQTYQLSVVLMFVFMASIGAANMARWNDRINMVQWNHRISLRPLYGQYEGAEIKVARIAGNANPDQQEPLIGLLLEGDPWFVAGPTVLFYSGRPLQEASTLDELAELTNEQEVKEILLAKKNVELLSSEYEIHVLAEVEPFVYATIRRWALTSPASSTPD